MMEAELAQKGAELLVETLKDFPRGQVGWKNRCSDTEAILMQIYTCRNNHVHRTLRL
jgi:hypothetical protein